MNQRQQRICVGAAFAIFVAAFSQLVHTSDSGSGKFDASSFLLEVAVILIIASVYFFKSKIN